MTSPIFGRLSTATASYQIASTAYVIQNGLGVAGLANRRNCLRVEPAMNLPPDVEFHEDIPLLVFRPRGLLNEASINKVMGVLGDLEAKLEEPFNRFCDTLEADAVDLNFQYIIHISLYRRMSYAGRPPVKSAILATDATAIHYGRLHAVLTQGSPIQVRVFEDRDVVAKWLGVPVERLIANSDRRTAQTREGV